MMLILIAPNLEVASIGAFNCHQLSILLGVFLDFDVSILVDLEETIDIDVLEHTVR